MNLKPTAKEYEGFHLATDSVNVLPDGTSVVDYYYDRNTYIIRYDSNGGEGEMEDTICTYGINCTLSLNTFTKTDYIINNWTGSNGTNYTNGQTVSNLSSINGDVITMTINWKAQKASYSNVTGGTMCQYIQSYGKSNKTFSYNGYSNCRLSSYSCGMDCDDMGHSYYGWGQFIWNDGGWWDVYSVAECTGVISCNG